MPPTFLAYLTAITYIPVAVLLVAVGAALLVSSKTRLLGKRLICATVATGPALVISAIASAIIVLLTAYALGLIVRPWTHDSQITEPVAAAVFGYSMLLLLIAAAAFVAASMVAGWRVGWGMASGLSMWEVIEADPLLRRLDPWYGRLRFDHHRS